MSSELAPMYAPAEIEAEITKRWNDTKSFHATPGTKDKDGKVKPPYSIVIPPPNVTAALHMGHALNNTLQDILTRYHRMAGFNTMWMPGTDHAGIATQTVVDKRLQAEGKPALKEHKQMELAGEGGRDKFIGLVQEWKDEYEGRITDQLKAMGCSCDWDRQAFTMDENCSKAVREAFFQLFKDGLIYRGKRLVNWDPATQTALADDEVEAKDVDGFFYYLKYPVCDKDGNLTGETVTVATTRPETMLGDTAVAVNPNDEANKHTIGQFVKLPIVNRVIPIIGDDYVVIADPESSDEKAKFASGFLKVTPAHDPNDYLIGQRHDLGVINVMALDASISITHGWPESEKPQDNAELAPFIGLSREDARKAIVKWFEACDLFVEKKPYKHSVGHSYRSHVPVEPYLSDQWYVKVTDERLAGSALNAMAPEQRQPSEGCVWKDQGQPTFTDTPTSRDREGADSQPYFITFTTYGTWLHGKEKGSVDRNHNILGQEFLSGDEEREKLDFAQMKQPAFDMDPVDRQVVQDSIVEVCTHRNWQLHALHVRTNHVHVVVTADTSPEKVMNDFKAYATRHLREKKQIDADRRVWTRHGSTRYLNTDETHLAAVDYVLDAQGQELEPAPVRGNPLPHGRGSSETPPSNTTTSRTRKEADSDYLRFYPTRYAKNFQSWHENIRDWCISRQLWWGHRIPVWSTVAEVSNDPSDQFPSCSAGENGEAYLSELQNRLDTYSVCIGIPESYAAIGQWEASEYKVYICVRDEKAAEYFIKMAQLIVKDAISQSRKKPLEGSPLPEIITESKEITDAAQSVANMLHGKLQQDPDVLDTWFSSGLWPMSTMGWPNETPELQTWNPTSVLCTAREIITLWVSRMVMFNRYFRKGDLPFKDVFIHAMIQDGHGQKMSKSLGNGVDPFDIIHLHGSDAMRFTLASMTTQTQDVRLPVDMVCPHTQQSFTPKYVGDGRGHKVAAPLQDSPHAKGKKMVSSYGVSSGKQTPTDEMPAARNTSEKFDLGRNFANKLWNAVRFSLSNLESMTPGSDTGELTLADRWILSRLAQTIASTTKAIKGYEFKPYADGLYDFVWRDFCDWYIEAIKPTIKTNPVQANVLATVLDAILRLLHPGMPYITEKLWERLNQVVPQRGVDGLELPASTLLVNAHWPANAEALIDADAVKEFDLLVDVVTAVRQVRTAYKIPPRQQVVCSIKASGDNAARLNSSAELLKTFAAISELAVAADITKPQNAASSVLGEMEVYLHDLVNADEEKERLGKLIADAEKQVAGLQGRLANPSYADKAPAHLVQQTRDQLTAKQAEVESLKQQLASL